jgi:ribonuclease BN (tRNA processing enzyme)
MVSARLLLALAGIALSASPAFADKPCPTFRWTTLGTAGGPVPTPERAEPSNLLLADDQQIFVDTGDGTVNQLAKAGLDLSRVRTVFISHHHMDHTGGLAAVIGLRWMNTMPGKLTVYGPPGTREIVDGAIKAMQPQARVGFGLGTASASPEGSVDVVEITDGSTVTLGPLKVAAVANSHFDHPGPKLAKDPVSLSYRFELDSRSITYSGDTGPSEALVLLAKGTDMLISEVIDLEGITASIRKSRPDMTEKTFNQMRRHLSTHHVTASDLGKIAAQAGAKRLVLTHFAVPPGPITKFEPALRRGIAQAYSGPVKFARDLSSFELSCT